MNSFQKTICRIFGIKIPESISYHQQRIIDIALSELETGKIVLVGDSITEGWTQTRLLPNNVINYGISGDTTVGVHDIVPLIINAKPAKVIINIGINDISFKNTAWTYYYKEFLKKLVARIEPKNIILCAVRPVNYLMPVPKKIGYINNVAVKYVNGVIQSYAFDHGCIYEPNTYTCHILSYPIDETLNPDHTHDGIHMTQKGYEAELEVLQKYL